jgi:hypothetical protein
MSLISMVGALIYARGIDPLLEIGLVAVGVIASGSLVFGALFCVVYLTTRQPVIDAASRLGDILKRNPKNVAQFGGVVLAFFAGACWIAATLPDTKFSHIGADKAIILCGASIITSICIAKYLYSSPRAAIEFKLESAPWVFYPLTWFLVTGVSMLLIISPK